MSSPLQSDIHEITSTGGEVTKSSLTSAKGFSTAPAAASSTSDSSSSSLLMATSPKPDAELSSLPSFIVYGSPTSSSTTAPPSSTNATAPLNVATSPQQPILSPVEHVSFLELSQF